MADIVGMMQLYNVTYDDETTRYNIEKEYKKQNYAWIHVQMIQYTHTENFNAEPSLRLLLSELLQREPNEGSFMYLDEFIGLLNMTSGPEKLQFEDIFIEHREFFIQSFLYVFQEDPEDCLDFMESYIKDNSRFALAIFSDPRLQPYIDNAVKQLQPYLEHIKICSWFALLYGLRVPETQEEQTWLTQTRLFGYVPETKWIATEEINLLC